MKPRKLVQRSTRITLKKVADAMRSVDATHAQVSQVLVILQGRDNPPPMAWRNLEFTLLRLIEATKGRIGPTLQLATEYHALLIAARARIRNTAMLARDTAPADWIKAHPDPDLPERNDFDWRTWVPRADRIRMIEAFSDAYDNQAHPTKRHYPFCMREEVTLWKDRITTLKHTMLQAKHDLPPTGRRSPADALLALCLRRAEREHEQRFSKNATGYVHPLVQPAPKHWPSLCPPDLRARLKRMLVDPADVDTHDLGAYL